VSRGRRASGTHADNRRRAEKKGRLAENRAALWLHLKGYRILDRRWSCSSGEIDLIAWYRNTLVAIEVKARATPEAAIQSVSWRNRQRIERAVAVYQGQNPGFSEAGLRFDIIAISGWRMVHVRDAWRQKP